MKKFFVSATCLFSLLISVNASAKQNCNDVAYTRGKVKAAWANNGLEAAQRKIEHFKTEFKGCKRLDYFLSDIESDVDAAVQIHNKQKAKIEAERKAREERARNLANRAEQTRLAREKERERVQKVFLKAFEETTKANNNVTNSKANQNNAKANIDNSKSRLLDRADPADCDNIDIGDSNVNCKKYEKKENDIFSSSIFWMALAIVALIFYKKKN